MRAVREDWPHPQTLREVALTTVSFQPSTGESQQRLPREPASS